MKKILDTLGTNTVAKSGMIVFVGSMFMNVAAYVYHLFMGRLLGPTAYGELSSLLSLLYVFTVPILVAQMVLVKFISAYKAKQEIGKTKSLVLSVSKFFAYVALIGFPIAFFVSPYVTEFLHLKSSVLFLLLYGMFAFSLLTIVMTSVLVGFQFFIWSSFLGAGAMILRLVISLPMTVWGVDGAMWATFIAIIVTYLIYFFPLKFIFKAKSEPIDIHLMDAVRFTIPTFLTMLAITSIYSMDVVLVRHYFSAKDAGMYAALAVLGKIIFYASSAITTVLFPIVSERIASGKKYRNLVLTSVGIVAGISALLSVGFFLYPEFIVRALFGASYTTAANYVGLFSVFLGIFSVGNSICLASLASGITRIWMFPVVAAIFQIVGIVLYHTSINSVILLNCGVSAFIAIGGVLYFNINTYEKI